MNEVDLRPIVAQAVDEAFDKWAQLHPSLAAVIDKALVMERTAESLRSSDEYKQAIRDYTAGREEMNILGSLIDLAEKFLPLLLA